MSSSVGDTEKHTNQSDGPYYDQNNISCSFKCYVCANVSAILIYRSLLTNYGEIPQAADRQR